MAALTATIAAGITITGAAVAVGGAVARGFSAKGKDTKGAAYAAEKIREEQIKLQNKETSSAQKQNKSQFEQATDSIRTAVSESNKASSSSLLKAYFDKSNMSQKTGFAGSGQLDYADELTQGTIRGSADIAMEKFETQQKGAEASYAFGETRTDIASQRSFANIEERFSGRLAEIGAVADTFWEGVWGADNEIQGYNYG